MHGKEPVLAMRGVPTTTRAGIITSLSTKKDLRVYSVQVGVSAAKRGGRGGGEAGKAGKAGKGGKAGATHRFENNSSPSCLVNVAGP